MKARSIHLSNPVVNILHVRLCVQTSLLCMCLCVSAGLVFVEPFFRPLVWQMKRCLRPCGYRATRQPCEVVAVTNASFCMLAVRVRLDYRVAPLAPIFLTPRMKEWQHLWDKSVLDEMDIDERMWVEYLNRKREASMKGKVRSASVKNKNKKQSLVNLF